MAPSRNFDLIKVVIDKYFVFKAERGGNNYMTDFIPDAMLDRSKEVGE